MIKKLLFGFILFILSYNSYSQVPANNDCSNATEVFCGDIIVGTTVDATGEDQPTLCGPTSDGNSPSVWYSFAGTGDIITVSLCGSPFDSQLQIFSGNCNTIICVEGEDDDFPNCGENDPEITFVSDASTNYLFYVDSFFNDTEGEIQMEITCIAPPPPAANDECLTALPLLVNADESCDLLNETLTIGGATTSSEANPCVGTANDDVWYNFIATATSHIVEISNVQGAPTDLVHSVYQGTCDALVNIACSDPDQSLLQNLTIGTSYTLRVFSLNTDPIVTTTFDLCIRQLPPAPINDECDDAIAAVVNADEFCNVITPGILAGATDSNLVNGCPGVADDDIWFEFVALSETHIIDIQNVTGNPSDLVHGVYEGDCDNLVEISCSDPDQSTIAGLTIGDTYFIRIFTAGDNPVNDVTFDLCIRLAPPPPTNDFCADAIAIACGESLAGTTTDSTDTDEPAALCGIFNNGDAPGVWYSFAGIDGSVTVSLCGSSFDTQLQVFSGDCDNLTCVAGNDDNFAACEPGNNSELVFQSELGTDYLIYVNGFAAAFGDFNIELTCLVTPPTIDIVCADGSFDSTFCYDDNSTIEQVFQGDSAFPLRLTINSGIVEDGDDEFIVLDSDGVTNLNAAMPYGTNGDLTGLVFTASGNSISFLVQSDASVSCADGANPPIDYSVVCLECTDPIVSYEVVGTCVPDQSFNVEVTVTDVGTAGSLTITDDVGGAPQTITAPGVVTMGPYDPLTDIVTLTLDSGDPNCTLTSEAFTFLCIVDGCYTILDAGEDVLLDCETECVDLMATFIVEPGLDTTEYLIQGPLCDVPPLEGGTPTQLTMDDRFTAAIDLPFTFNFYGNDYTQLAVGANGQLTFNAASFDTPSGFAINPGETLPRIANPQFPANTIHGAFHDIDPSVTDDETQINYFISGVAPNRIFVLNFNNIPHFGFSCEDVFFTSQQILLYESLNVIDVNLINKPFCVDWNDGLATLGLQGNDLTEFSVPTDRNTGVWEAQDETWRFVPNGAQNTASSFTWTDPSGTVVGTEALLNVCPTASTTYTATLTTELPDGTFEILEDEVVVEREQGCIDYDCVDTQFFEGFGEGTTPVDHPFLPAPYVFDGGGQLDEAEYSVQNGMSPINNGWHTGLIDQTPDDTNGNALIINASLSNITTEFYRRDITVVPNTDYFFVIWVTTMYDIDSGICPDTGDPTNFDYRFETTAGATIVSANTGDIDNESDVNWQRFSVEFNSGTNTTLELVLDNTNFGVCGNDFAIDDLGLYFEGTPPVIAMPDNIIGCDEDEDGFVTYDLTDDSSQDGGNDQILAILDGLTPAEFTVTFYNTEDDAMNAENAIADPTMYTNMVDPETIWVRVARATQPNCFSITQFNIEIGPNLDLGVDLPSEDTTCSNEDFPFLDGTVGNTNIDESMITYEWHEGDINGPIVSTEPMFRPEAAGIYTLQVFAPVCGVNIYTVEVIRFAAPDLDLGPDQSFCEGDDAVELSNRDGDIPDATYQWSLDDVDLVGETNSTLSVNTTGLYTLTVMVDVCTVSSFVMIEYLANPVVTLDADFKTCPDMDTTLTSTVDVEGDLVYEWLDPNGDVVTNEAGVPLNTPSIVIQVPAGTLVATYTLNVLNGSCIGTDSIDITLYDVDNCIISEGISPNGDQFNETLDLEFLNDRSGIEQFQIFNRHGLAVYTERDYVNQWGGQTDDGEELPTGTYFYVIVLENEDPEYGREASGWVYLNREQ